MENSSNNCVESSDIQHKDEQDQWEISWEEVFEGVPTAPDTEAAQERHAQLRRQDTLTADEEAEFNALFYEIYPQFIPDIHQDPKDEDRLKYHPSSYKETGDDPQNIRATLLAFEICWCGITILHFGLTFHGLVGCALVWVMGVLIGSLVGGEDPGIRR